MKLTLGPNDSIYKIFKLLKKIPSGKQVDVFLDTHPILEQQRWMDAFIEQVQQGELIIILTTKNKQIADYLGSKGITVNWTPSRTWYHPFQQFLKKIGRNIDSGFGTKEYFKSKLGLAAELLVIVGIIWMFRGTISPKATISIMPSIHIEPITYGFLYYSAGIEPERILDNLIVPRYTGQIDYRVSKTIDLSSFDTNVVSARGHVTIFNTTPETISLLEKTQLITDDGITFTLDTRAKVPPGTPEKPGTQELPVTADPYSSVGEPVGELGNIKKATKLLINKLPESKEEQKIRAYPTQNFTNGATIYSGTVVSQDIQRLEKLLLGEIKEQLHTIIQTDIGESPYLALPIESQTQITTNRFITNAQPGQSASFLQGTLEVTILYPYIRKKELLEQINTYLEQRPSPTNHLESISTQSINFYTPRAFATGAYIIPTTVQTFWSYNFDQDNYQVKEKIAEQVIGLSKKDALGIILQQTTVQTAAIHLSPPWYTTLPTSVEKINIAVQKPISPEE